MKYDREIIERGLREIEDLFAKNQHLLLAGAHEKNEAVQAWASYMTFKLMLDGRLGDPIETQRKLMKSYSNEQLKACVESGFAEKLFGPEVMAEIPVEAFDVKEE